MEFVFNRLKIRRILFAGILSAGFSIPPAYSQNNCIGWATVDGKTTGGEGGAIVSVASRDELVSQIAKGGKRVIRIKGKIAVQRISMSEKSDMTIEGAEGGAELEATFYIGECSNLIFRNLIISAVAGGQMDIFCIEENSHHIWIDHCDISDKRTKLDGLVDITHGCDNITVSWNKFHYPGKTTAHRFAMLISHSDDAGGEDAGKERITIHHNWWAENIHERMPRARFGQIHVFNNYYNSVGNNYCIGPGKDAKAVVESNYFETVNNPHIFFDSVASAQIRTNNDNYYATDVTGRRDAGQGAAFVIPYLYTLDRGAHVKQIVTSGAGPFKTPAPLPVFGGGAIPMKTIDYRLVTSLPKTYTLLGSLISGPGPANKTAMPVIISDGNAVMRIQIMK